MSEETLDIVPDILNRISEQLEKIEKNNQQESDVAVLWDVENVNPGNDASFMEGLQEYLRKYGRLTITQAFADWTRKSVSSVASLLSNHHFELIHVPAARKNSADISLITYGIELALQYPAIKTFVLVTGDSDFRPLVKSLRRSGKKILIICDMKTARADFLILADEFKDYRTLRPGGSTPAEMEPVKSETVDITFPDIRKSIDKAIETQTVAVDSLKQEQLTMRRNNAFDLLIEAITQMKKEKIKPGIGIVKVRLLMLNPDFDEKSLGFSNWSDFINTAHETGIIQTSGESAGLLLDITQPIKDKTDQEKAFDMLLELLEKFDEGNKPRYHNQAQIAGKLYTKPKFMKLKKILDFKKFKDFIQAAEVRKLVETKVDGLLHEVKRVT